MKVSCMELEFEARKMVIGGAGLNGESDEDNKDGFDYGSGLYNEQKNGVWKGRGYYFEILLNREMKDSVNYIEVHSKGIFVYDS